MVLAEVYVSKDKPDTKPEESPNAGEPEVDLNADPATFDYTEPVKVPLWFKQRLERIAQRHNQEQKRKDKSARKLPLGYFVVRQLREWAILAADDPDQE